MKDIVILIPVYNPSGKLEKLVHDLIQTGFSNILIINDGSTSNLEIFDNLSKKDECTILSYKDNRGKGYAIKYGISYYLENLTTFLGIIMVDADYQHLPKDILNLTNNFHDNKIILGYRDFSLDQVPFTNRYGNRITSGFFKILYGKKLNDTQTGLRLIPNKYLNLCLEIPGNRFEYEMQQLICFAKEKIDILEIPIETVYYKKGESKYKKIRDSILIYKVLFTEPIKFLFSSLTCALLDILLFMFLMQIFTSTGDNLSIIFATFIARMITDFFNFNVNRNFVFNSNANYKKVLVRYYILSISKMIASATLVLIFHHLVNINDALLKMIVDITLYFVSYKIQKSYIFKE